MKNIQIYLKAIQCYMIENGINQEELAQRLGVSPAAIGKWLIGHNGITMRNRKKIAELCSKWISDHADVVLDASDEEKEQLRTAVSSLRHSSLADRSGDPVVSTVELFRHRVVMALYDIDMPVVIRNQVIRTVSNIESSYLIEMEGR